MGISTKIIKDHLQLENIGTLSHSQIESLLSFLEANRSRYIGLVTKPTFSVSGNDITLSGCVAFLCETTSYNENTKGENKNITGATFTIPTERTPYYVVAKRVGASASYELQTSEVTFARPNQTLVMIIIRIGSDFHVTQSNTIAVGLPEKLNQLLIDKYRFQNISGCRIASTDLNVEISAGVIGYGASLISVDQFLTPSDQITLLVWNGTNFVESNTSSANNTQYNGASGFTALSNNHFVVNWFFRSVENHKHVYSVLSRSQYNKITDAINSNPPAVPSYVYAQAMFIGGIIYVKNNPTPQYIIESTETDLVEGGVSLHNELGSIQGGNAGEYFHLTQSQYTDLTDGNDSTLHYHASDRDRANHTGEQAISTVTGLQTALNLKLEASDIANFETTTQLNARDTANRNRANHTGSQLASTISDFSSTVLATLLTGIGFLTGSAVVATDSILVAIGKLQKQITDLIAVVSGKENAGVAATLLSNHESAVDPHSQYATDSALTSGLATKENTGVASSLISSHESALNPHPQYTNETYTGIAERTVGGITDGQNFVSKTMTEMWDSLIKQEKFPVLTAPSSTFTSSITGLREVGEVLSSIVFNSTFDRGSITPQYTAASPYRSGLPNTYQFTGSGLSNQSKQDLSDSQTINNYTVLINSQNWQGRVAYDGGVQPKSSYNNDYSTPLSAGQTGYVTRTITGVYPFFATTSNLTTMTKQSLQNHASTITVSMVAEDGTNKQKLEVAVAYGNLSAIQQYNTLSGLWDNISVGSFTMTVVSRNINGTNVDYRLYTHNGSTIGARQVRFIF